MKYRLPLIIASLLFFCVSMWAQPALAPLTENDFLRQNVSGPLQSGIQTDRIYIMSGEDMQYCLPEALGFTRVDSIVNLDCGSADFYSVLSLDSCSALSAVEVDSLEKDSLCLMISDSLGKEEILQVEIYISPALALPFVEDFSHEGAYPREEYWQDRNVFVNRDLAIHPPSLGVATFDGTGPAGTPYEGSYGNSDFLSSNFIDLSNSSDPALYFWAQARGQGTFNFPEGRDSLAVDFLDQNGHWKTVHAIPGIDSDTVVDFIPVKIPIPPEMRRNDFQFRIRNKSQNRGMASLWHVDYIFVLDQNLNFLDIPDIAFYQAADYIISPYTSMPYSHFQGNEEKYLIDLENIYIRNNAGITKLADESGIEITELKTGSMVLPFETLLELPPTVPVNQRNLDPGRYHFENDLKTYHSTLNNIRSLPAAADDSLTFEHHIYYEASQELRGLEANNSVTTRTVMHKHFAYDDGTAEVGIYIPAGSSLPYIVQEYEFEKADSLRGVQMYFPRISPRYSDQRFSLVLWSGELSGEPDIIRTFDNAIFNDAIDDNRRRFTFCQFKTTEGKDTVLYIPKGKVYIGWQQISSNTERGVYLGFDKSNDQSDKIWYNSGSEWKNLGEESGTIKGAIMIRPIVGNRALNLANKPSPAKNYRKIHIFPNPGNDIINLDYKGQSPRQLRIFNAQGKTFYSGAAKEKLEVSSYPPGIYYLYIELEGHEGRFTHKIIIQ